MHSPLETLEPRIALSVAPAPVVLGPNVTPMTATTDAQGNVLLVGGYSGVVDFDTRRNHARTLDAAADGPLFVAKYSPAGALVWATPYEHASDILSGVGPEVVAVAAGRDGGIYLTGRLTGAYDFDPGPRRRVLDNHPADGLDHDAFVWKLNADGSFAYVTLIRPAGIDSVDSDLQIVTDADGSAYVVGTHFSDDAVSFVARVTPDGRPDWATQLEPYSVPADLALDPARQAPVVLTRDGQRGIAVNHLSAAGHVTDRVRLAISPTSGGVLPGQLAIDSNGNLFVSGTVQHLTDFDPDPSSTLPLAPGSQQNEFPFLAKYTADHRPVFARLLNAAPQDLAVDSATGGVVMAGQFQNAVDLDPTAHGSFVVDTGDTYALNGGQTDLFAARFSAAGRFLSGAHLGVARAFDDFVGLGVTPDHRPAVVSAILQSHAPRDRFAAVFRV